MKKKYYLDFEFIEGFRKFIWWLPSFWFFNKKYWHIEVISIGIYCEDGRSYYAVSNEFNSRWANDWVKKNVFVKLPSKYIGEPDIQTGFDFETGKSVAWVHREDNPVYKSLEQIKMDILDFVGAKKEHKRYGDGPNVFFVDKYVVNDPVLFYGYYCDYDWVLFCSIFGAMVDLPKGMPMYCIDLKQEFDRICQWTSAKKFSQGISTEGWAKKFKEMKEYPQQINEHNALDDAKWNYELLKFLEVVTRSL